MSVLTPDLSILPPSQRQLWSRLSTTPDHFVLYGGTGLALRLGHRESIDFDFFSSRSFQPPELTRLIPYLDNQRVTQQAENTLSCEIDSETGIVKVSFFGGLSIGQIEHPDQAEGCGIRVASLRDLFGTKCATVPQRNESKDYVDIHALISESGITLSEGIACARAIYGRQYNPLLTLQALSYYDDLTEPLTASLISDLQAAVKSVSLEKLPPITARQTIGERARTR